MEVDVVSLASEFPNDNPALHCGVIWICDEPTGLARAERVAPSCPTITVEAPAPDVPEATVDDSFSEIAAAALTPDVIAEVLAMPELEADAFASPDVDHEDVIAVEELEPIEASVEGELVASPESELVEAMPPSQIELVVESMAASVEEIEAASSEIEVSAEVVPAIVEEVELSPLTVVAEELPAIVEEMAPPTVVATPIFEEVAACAVVPTESSVLPAAPEDPFTLLVCTLADVAIGAGSPHVASMLPGLLFDARLPEPLDPEILGALEAAGIASGGEVTSAFVAVTAAWREILRGTSDDFDACGAAMLDEWCSDLLARLLAAPGRAPALRQELRTRGVAAFGMAA